jgi:hypothetical protein
VYVNELSFDPRHPWFVVPGIDGAEWAIEVFTTHDVWGLDPASTTFDGLELQSQQLQGLGGQRSTAGLVTTRIDVADGVTEFHISASHADPIKGVKLLVRGLPAGILDAGWWTPTTPAGQAARALEHAPVLLRYPWDSWQTPWACAGEGPGFAVGVRTSRVAPIRLYQYAPHWSPEPVIEVVCDAPATERRPTFESPAIRLRLAQTVEEIHADLLSHLSWIENAFGLIEWDRRGDVPAWARDIDLVLTLHGQHWTGYVFNTFDRMAEILREVTQLVDGSHILAYLPGWEGRYYWQYPCYWPGEDLGGPSAFARLVETANDIGVHLMPMFGANGAHAHRYPDWERAALRSPSNRYFTPINTPDWDNDRAAEDDQIFLNPGEPDFRAHLVEQISTVVATFGIEGVFLDTSGCWVNDGRYDVFDGYRSLVGELRTRHAALLVCGEGWYDALLGIFPMNQTWLDMSVPPRVDALPMRYARVLGHLKDGAPGAGSTGVHEGGTSPRAHPLEVRGYVPALSIVDDTLPGHADAVRDFCLAVAKART